ncbi:MAG: hypothetical protein AAGJ18_20825 [Bacteroidota bacterium]
MNIRTTNITIYTLWTCDPWLSISSFNLEGIFSTKENAIKLAKAKRLCRCDNQVVINKGLIDNYDNTEHRVFNTQKSRDRAILKR